MKLATALNFLGDRIHRLPLAIVYVTERCNSRCITCDFWKHGTSELDVERARSMAKELRGAGTEAVLLTGGEVLFHSRWQEVASAFREVGLRIWLLTAGLSLRNHVAAVADLCDRVTVSLDGAEPDTYQAIRGVNALHEVLTGIRALVKRGVWVSIRSTIQRQNYREMPAMVRLAKELEVKEISFLAVDVASELAFSREHSGEPWRGALRLEDLPPFSKILTTFETDFADELESGFIAESAEKLWHLHKYFSALCGEGSFPPVRCNAPRFSAVVRANGELQPCHFIPGVAGANGASLSSALNSREFVSLRRQIRTGKRQECRRCVCPMWKSPRALVLDPLWPEPSPVVGS